MSIEIVFFLLSKQWRPCADQESFVRGGSILTTFFKLMGWRGDRNATKSGPSSACQQNDIEMAFLWHADNGPPLNAGLVAL